MFELKTFEIPIEEYEEDMQTESSKEKEIIDLFKNHNKLHSEYEYDQIKFRLHEACRGSCIDLIKIYLSETIDNYSTNLTFKIDKTTKTASLFKVNDNNDKLITKITIPRTVQHESIDYLITSISGIDCESIKTINFEEDSAVETIYGFLFQTNNKIEEIYFPASLKELKESWCYYTPELIKIVISPSNDQFIFKDDKYLLSKTDPNNDEFDNLQFACRDIKEISIPSNIKIISSYAFSNCNNLTKIDISANSNLQTIGTSVFSGSKIKEIYFPANLKELKYGWCFGANNLSKIIISPLNGQFIFKDEKYLLGKTDSNSDEFDNLLFACRDIKEFSIPLNIKIISPCAFSSCKNLIKVEISANSNLQRIGTWAFSFTNIEEILIPSNVSKICNGAFQFCKNLRKIEFASNSNLQTIGPESFIYTKIKEIFIPSKVSKICKSAFSSCKNLRKIEFASNSNLQIINNSAFACSGINKILIPSNVSKICDSAFSYCSNLTKVTFASNSNLQTIESYAFSWSKIEAIFIPQKVSKICKYAFSYCDKLQIFEISENSKLESLSLLVFNGCSGTLIMCPSSLKKIKII